MKSNVYIWQSGAVEKGGLWVQASRTVELLRQQGTDAKLFVIDPAAEPPDRLPRDADVHHFMSFASLSEPWVRAIRGQSDGLIALSTVYWWTPRVQRVATPGRWQYWRRTWPARLRRLMKWRIARYRAVPQIDLFLPNSPGEGRLVQRDFPLRPDALICPVPNGTDAVDASAVSGGDSVALPKRYVLCAGMFNPRKNQLGLIQALKGRGIPIVFLGGPSVWSTAHTGYYQRCVDEADGMAVFCNSLPHRSPAWHQVFSNAAAFVMPSACETPSLAALEAAQMECPLALTDIGSTREYFGSYAHYCQPEAPTSIRRAVERAFQQPRSSELARHVKARFQWSRVAQVTRSAYEAALDRSSSARATYEASVADLWHPHDGNY